MNPASPNRYAVLDGLRGICALCVMLYHYTDNAHKWFYNSPAAVDLFFMLSGFVLSASYGRRIAEGGISLSGFMKRRLIRLYPMLLAGLFLGTIALIIYAHYGHTTYTLRDIWAGLGSNLFLLPYLNTGEVHLFEGPYTQMGAYFPSDNALWSLFCEISINLFMFSFFRCSLKALKIVVLIALTYLFIYGFFHALDLNYIGLDNEAGGMTLDLTGGLPRVAFGFSLGVLIYRISHSDTAPALPPRLLKALNNPLWLYAAMIAVLAIPGNWHGLRFVGTITLICPVILYLGARSSSSNMVFVRLSTFLGWLSYPIYCLHMPIGNFVGYLANEGGLKAFMPLPFMVTASLATLAIAIALTRLYEEPARNYLTQKLGK